MRRPKNRVVVLLGGLVLLTVAAATAEACWRCRDRGVVVMQPAMQPVAQPAVQQVVQQVVQVVQVVQEPTKPNDSRSQVVRALVIVDDNSPNHDFNAQLLADGGSVLGMLHNLREICPNPTMLSRKEATRDRILEEINYRMKVGPDDTLLVYYVGHGSQDEQWKNTDQKGHYLDLYGGSSIQKLWRADLLQAMRARNPRLLVLLTDACFAASSPSEESTEIKTSRFKAAQKVPEQNRNESLVRHLFLEQRGLVNINSCKPDEKAFADVFTPILVKQMTEWAGESSPTWEAFFNVVQKQTAEKSKEVLSSQETALGSGGKQEAQTPFSFAEFSEVMEVPAGTAEIPITATALVSPKSKFATFSEVTEVPAGTAEIPITATALVSPKSKFAAFSEVTEVPAGTAEIPITATALVSPKRSKPRSPFFSSASRLSRRR